jgi:hypothetical protein
MNRRYHPQTQGSGLAVTITLIAVVAVAAILYFGFNYFESQKILPNDQMATSATATPATPSGRSSTTAIGASDDVSLDADIAALDGSMDGASQENAQVDGYLKDSGDTF